MIVAGLVLTSLVAGSGLGTYAADYQVEATIVDKDCAGPQPSDPEDPQRRDRDDREAERPNGTGGANSTVTIRPHVLGTSFETTVADVDDEKCHVLRTGEDGNYVTYRVRTETTVFYEREGGVCIYHSVYGPGCVLPGALERAPLPTANASFTLSTSGYSESESPGPASPANCATFPADDVRAANVTARWEPTATDDTLRLVVQAVDADEEPIAEEAVAGPAALNANASVPDEASRLVVGMYPEDEAVGSTSSIAVHLTARGVSELPDASPEPCRQSSDGNAPLGPAVLEPLSGLASP